MTEKFLVIYLDSPSPLSQKPVQFTSLKLLLRASFDTIVPSHY
jgi:hypothetical protein